MRREGAQLDRVGSRCGSGAGGVVRTLEPAMEDQLECGPSRVVTGLDLGGDEEAAEHVDFRRHPVSGERAEPSSVLRRGPSLVPGDVQRRPACPSTQSSTSSSTSPMWPRRWVGSPLCRRAKPRGPDERPGGGGGPERPLDVEVGVEEFGDLAEGFLGLRYERLKELSVTHPLKNLQGRRPAGLSQFAVSSYRLTEQ